MNPDIELRAEHLLREARRLHEQVKLLIALAESLLAEVRQANQPTLWEE